MKNYVTTAYRKAWICFDLDNGHSWGKNDPGKGYIWVFITRKEATEHKRKQKKHPFAARLSQPIKVQYEY